MVAAWRSRDVPATETAAESILSAVALADNDAQARAMLTEQLRLCRRWGEPSDLGAALRVARFETEPEARAEWLAEAVEALTGADDRLEHAPKTVENHLGRVYSTLGIGYRRELAGALS